MRATGRTRRRTRGRRRRPRGRRRPGRLRQLLVNVLDNAARHSPAATSVRGQRRRADGGDTARWLEVVDAGGGVRAAGPRPRLRAVRHAAGHRGRGHRPRTRRWPAGWPTCTAAPSASSTPSRAAEHGSGSRCPGRRAPRPSSPRRHPSRPDAPARHAPSPPPVVPPPTPRPAVRAGRRVRPLLARPRRPARARTVVAASGAGSSPASPCRSARSGITWTLVAAGARRGRAGHRASATRAVDPRVRGAGRAARAADDPPRRRVDAMLGLLVGGAVFLCGVTGARTLPGSCCPGWRGRSPRCAACRGSAGRSAIAGTGSAHAGRGAYDGVSLLGVLGLRHDLRQRQRVFGDVGRPARAEPDLQRPRGRAFLACRRRRVDPRARRTSRSTPPNVERWPATTRRGSRTASSGSSRCCSSTPCSSLFLAAQAAALVGGRDYIEATTGLTYAEYVHQGFGQLTVATALTLLVVWASPRSAPATSAEDRPWLRGSLGLLCVLTLLVVASALRRMARLPGRLRLHHAAALRRRLRGLARLRRARDHGRRRGRCAGCLAPAHALVTGAVALVGLAAINPDAWVAGQQHRPLRGRPASSTALPPGPLRRRDAGDRGPAAAGGRPLRAPACGQRDARRASTTRGVEPGPQPSRGALTDSACCRPASRRRTTSGRRPATSAVTSGRPSGSSIPTVDTSLRFLRPDLVRRAADVTGSGESPSDPTLIHF